MDIEFIPTVQSLLKHDAISVKGDSALIKKLSRHIQLQSFKREFILMPSYSEMLPIIDNISDTPELTDSINRPLTKAVLYSIILHPDKFELLSHTHSDSGCSTQSIYTKSAPNPKRLGSTFRALYRRIDESKQFVICKRCKQLVGAALCHENTCSYNCDDTYKQVFDSSLVDRVTCSGIVSVLKDKDYIKFYIVATDWLDSHSSLLCHRVIGKLPLTASFTEVNALKHKLEDEQEYPAPCYHCKKQCNEGDAIDLESLVDFDTDAIVCYSCATEHYGVIY
jgi:hypothetical protein